MNVFQSSSAFLNVYWVYILVGIVFFYVLLQSVFFLVKSYKKAKTMQFSDADLRKTIVSSMVFSIAPSFAILIGLVILSSVFGSMIAGMRLATLGAFTYELPAATNVIKEVYNKEFSDFLSQDIVVTALWVMTLGCIPPLFIVPLFLKKMNLKMKDMKKADNKWNPIMMDALFIGMISAFVGYVVAPKTPEGLDPYISVVAILTFVSSGALITIFGIMLNKLKWDWLKNYALPLSMIIAMALAILYTEMGLI